MATLMKPGVLIVLDKPRTLRYGMRAMIRVEEALKIKITKLNELDLSMRDLATIIWAGLVHEDPNLVVDAVIDLIDDFSSIDVTSKKMNEAIDLAFGTSAKVSGDISPETLPDGKKTNGNGSSQQDAPVV